MRLLVFYVEPIQNITRRMHLFHFKWIVISGVLVAEKWNIALQMKFGFGKHNEGLFATEAKTLRSKT